MLPLIQLFWRLCQLKATPQDVPYSQFLLVMVAIANGALGWGQLSYQKPAGDALVLSGLLLLLTLVFIVVVLQLCGMGSRFLQTTVAILGTGTLISLVALPLLGMQHLLLQIQQPTYFYYLLSSLFLLAVIAVNVWILIVTAHIFRHSLNTTLGKGMLVTLALVGINITVFSFITR